MFVLDISTNFTIYDFEIGNLTYVNISFKWAFLFYFEYFVFQFSYLTQ